MIKEYDSVILKRDIPEQQLEDGDIGVVVEVYNGNEGYEVEFMTLDGNTVAICTLEASDIEQVGAQMVPHVRRLAV